MTKVYYYHFKFKNLMSFLSLQQVRSKMLSEKDRLSRIESATRNRQAKKFGKQIQKEKEREKIDQKRADLDAVAKWRKG